LQNYETIRIFFTEKSGKNIMSQTFATGIPKC
jgi:hypothetical protein